MTWIVFRRSSPERRDDRNYKKSCLDTCSLSMLDVSFGLSGSRFYMDALFSHAPLEAIGGFSDVVIPALLHCPIPLTAMTATSS